MKPRFYVVVCDVIYVEGNIFKEDVFLWCGRLNCCCLIIKWIKVLPKLFLHIFLIIHMKRLLLKNCSGLKPLLTFTAGFKKIM